MKTRNEILDRLIDSLEINKADLYYSWADNPVRTPSWESSFEYTEHENLEKEIQEYIEEYD